MRNIVLRYATFVLGLYFLSLGVVLIVTSSLGTTPISSINYVVSLNTPITLGAATFIINMLLILGQFWLLRGMGTRTDRFEVLLQIPFSLVFSVFIDANMAIMHDIPLPNYGYCLALLGIGIVAQAVGVVLELKPNVAIMSAEGFVKYASRRYNKDFGRLKVRFDVALVSSAAVLSLFLAGEIQGIREGTVAAAVATGYVVSFLSNRIMTRRNLSRALALVGKN